MIFFYFRYLSYTLNANKIRKQDATSVIVSIASNVEGQTLAWDFVRTNWEYMFTECVRWALYTSPIYIPAATY